MSQQLPQKKHKKKYVSWAKGFVDYDGTKKVQPYLEVGFPFDSDKK